MDAFFEWLGCRCGTAGDSARGNSEAFSSTKVRRLISNVDIERRRGEAPSNAGVNSKKVIFLSVLGDVTGEMLPTLEASVNCVSLDLLEVDEASSSVLIREEEPEETLIDALRCACMTATSGAS
jgi:hypothetical protein